MQFVFCAVVIVEKFSCVPLKDFNVRWCRHHNRSGSSGLYWKVLSPSAVSGE